MKPLGLLGVILCCGAVSSYAETWSAKVLDATCYDAHKATEKKSSEDLARQCAATTATKDFVIQTSEGKVYRVDTAGSGALAKDLRDGVLKKDKDGDIHANISGSREGETVNVTSVNVQGK
jgi:hypothetical protein